MKCQIIDLGEYRESLEKKEREEIEALAEEVRAALADLGTPEDYGQPFTIYPWTVPEVELDLLYDLPIYNYSSNFLHGSCPHCGKNVLDPKSE